MGGPGGFHGLALWPPRCLTLRSSRKKRDLGLFDARLIKVNQGLRFITKMTAMAGATPAISPGAGS